MNTSEFGFRIKQCRKNKKLTQEKLAELIDISPHYLYEIERGLKTMSLSTFADLAMALGTTTDYLLFGEAALPTSAEINTDKLNRIIKELPPMKREALVKILEVMVPLLN